MRHKSIINTNSSKREICLLYQEPIQTVPDVWSMVKIILRMAKFG